MRASSTLPIKELLNRVKEITSGGRYVLQVFEPEAIINKMHLVSAYLNAILAFGAKSNISNSVAVEMMLYAALTRQITEAIGSVGVKSEKDMVVFADSKESYAKIKDYLSKDSDFVPTGAHMKKAAKALKITSCLDDLSIMQEVAIARLGQ
jgi:tRNA threonylcarbamoyladenosine modification (KEOPS) complex Cgi121 subunit